MQSVYLYLNDTEMILDLNGNEGGVNMEHKNEKMHRKRKERNNVPWELTLWGLLGPDAFIILIDHHNEKGI